jgi:hypothetical protein
MQGFKGLTFLSAHLAAIGGIIGLPGSALLGPMLGFLKNLVDQDDDKDWDNWQEDLRKSLGAGGEGSKRNWFADLLYKGAPYALLSMDTSDRLGMGNIAALAPYTDLPDALTSKDKFYSAMGKAMLGPSGGILGKLVDGWGFGMEQGDWTRAAESIAPVGISNAMKAARFHTMGLTNKQGDVLMTPEDISALDLFYTAIGVRPRSLVNQAERASAAYDANTHYDEMTTGLKNRYTRAAKSKDASSMQDVRAEWQQIQAARKRDGFKPQPLSTLLKAPAQQRKREHGAIGGVEASKVDRMFLADMMFADTPGEAQALDDEP